MIENADTKNIRDELIAEIAKMTESDLWKVHMAVNEIRHQANLMKYKKRGVLLTPEKNTLIGKAGQYEVHNG